MISGFTKIVRKSMKLASYPLRRAKLKRMFDQGLPRNFEVPLRFLLDQKLKDANTKALVQKIEGIRKEIASEGTKKISIMYSPKPGTSGEDTSESARPKHGKELYFTMEEIAITGKNQYWGTFLHLLASCSKSKTIVELGSCAGISGCYLSSSPLCERFVTVEGSDSLARLAQKNLIQVNDKAIVYNMLFDDAMDIFLPKMEQGIDFVFIDGHHEKVATIHYFERVRPYLVRGGVVVFDDISWSHDMREAWSYLSKRKEFTHSLDLGAIGVCIWDGDSSQNPLYWDIQPAIGKVSIGNPHGWKNND